MRLPRMSSRGFSFIEVLVTAALVSLVFGGLYASVTAMVSLIGASEAKAGATAIAVERIEFIRSLPYNAVGTVGGVPAGLIPQVATSSLNGIIYTESILVEFVDDPADGFGAADANGILADYKRARVEVAWESRGATSSISLVTTVVPVGIETTAGGGTIRVNVFDANASPVSNAVVRFLNTTTTSTIDTTRTTNSSGVAFLSGAPAAANYQIFVSRSGYSSDQTYTATTTNPNPATPPLAVVESAVSTMNFQIDRLGELTILTRGVPTFGTVDDTFADASNTSTSSDVAIGGGVTLAQTAGLYAGSGSLRSTAVTPGSFDRWYSLAFVATSSPDTAVAVSLYFDNAGSWELVPDADLPGNSAGFTTSPVNLQDLSVASYPTLMLAGTLTTTDTSQTPTLTSWGLTYVVSQPIASNVPLTIRGTKVIGTDASAQPIYKYAVATSTNGSGELYLPTMEFDSYTITVESGDDVLEACPVLPYYLAPDEDESIDLQLGTISGSRLRVMVTDIGGAAIPDAAVRLENAGYDVLRATSLCGQTFFSSGGLYEDGNYTLTVSKPGFNTVVVASTTVSTSTETTVVLSPM